MPEILVLHGPPGSGKTTHGQRFEKQYPENVRHVSIGNRLRDIRLGEVESKFKQEIDEQAHVLAASEPLDHETVNGAIFEFIKECPSMATVLVDGYPRFIEQLPFFYESIELEKHLLLGVILLNITESTSMSRLQNRGARRNEKEVDQNFASWRFNEYQRRTFPTIALLGTISRLIEIDANPSEKEVWEVFNQTAYELIFNK